MIKEVKEINEVLDFAWNICKDNTKSSYPKYKTKEDLKSNIERAINSDIRKIIACYKNNELKGVCIYFWINEDKYSQTEALLIENDYDVVADEFMEYIRDGLEGYELLIGITAYNEEAIQYLENRKMECIDSSIVTLLYKKNYKPHHIKTSISLLDFNEFDEYAKFHDKYAGDMYWDSNHIKKDFDIFDIYIYRENGVIKGSIFVRKIKKQNQKEVVGLFLDDDVMKRNIESDLISEMLKDAYKEYSGIDSVLYFIEEKDEDELKAVIDCGFEIQDRYKCYKYIFE